MSLDPFEYTYNQHYGADPRRAGSGVTITEDGITATAQGREGNDDGSDDGANVGGGGRPSQATILTELAEGEADLWHDPDGEAWATVPVHTHREHHQVRTRPFKTWLRRKYWERNQRAPGSNGVQDAVENLCGIALFDRPERQVHLRVAEHEGAVYLDLADEEWRAVEITAEGWRVVNDPPVVFQRKQGMESLPEPQSGGQVNELRRFLNVEDEDWPLVAGWLAAAATPFGPYPVLALQGRQGSAKTTAMRILRRLVDPNVAPEREKPRDVRDLMIAAHAGHVVSFDNLSGLPEWLSDALSRLATGAGFATRQLYTDDDEAIFHACRPVVANGIEAVATRADLLDRSIIVSLEQIPDTKRAREADLWPAFDAARPRILGALLDVVASGLARYEDVELDRLPRMADFATWVAACAPALGIQPDEFMTRYDANRANAQRTAVEASVFASAVLELMDKRESWIGTPSDLLTELTTEERGRTRGWPKSPQAVTGNLSRLAPSLEEVGVTATYSRHGNARTWVLTRTAVPSDEDDAGSSSPKPHNDGDRDGRDENDGSIPTPSDQADADAAAQEGVL